MAKAKHEDSQSPEATVFEAATALAQALAEVPMMSFPWRDTRDPYLILVAEMMLMRTRADLVVSVYRSFADRYPTAQALASADEDALRELLTPLGLLKRIPFFRRAARYIVREYPDGLPRGRRDLEKIPGVGRYTADAVRAFAFEEPIVPADVNVLRWIARVAGLPMTNASKGSPEIRALLPALEPLGARTAYKFLDFTRKTCRARIPQCSTCPVIQMCYHGRNTMENV